MASRLELHEELCNVLGSRNVYYQPPESIQMKYPAIVYSLDNIEVIRANDGVYGKRVRYSVTYIDRNPDNDKVMVIAELPYCRFTRYYVSDNLNHYNYTLYF